MLLTMDFLILFNTSCRIYSIPKESKYTAIFVSINNETQFIPLLWLLSRFMTCVPYSLLRKLTGEKAPVNLGS